MKRDRIVQFASSYLRAEDFNDCCVNGLQVAGAKDVERVDFIFIDIPNPV